jgi:predicted transcriptional regulator
VFTVRLPVRLAAAVREHARASGRTVSSVAAQALEEFLGRTHGNDPRR